jgi:hypothetical protein
MAVTYTINFTDPNKPYFTINPVQLDGPGQASGHSSLTLFGDGKLQYGEKGNENWLHLLENYASDEFVFPNVTANPLLGAASVFALPGNWIHVFVPNHQFNITASTSGTNDGVYTTLSSTYDVPNDTTLVTVTTPIPDINLANVGAADISLVQPDPILVPEPWVIGQVWMNQSKRRLFVYVKLPTGLHRWIPVGGAVTVSFVTPQNAFEGDLWFDENIPQLKIFYQGTWDSVAKRYVEKSGDSMNGDGQGGVGTTKGVLKFENGTNDFLFIGEGQGNPALSPDIRASGILTLGGDTGATLYINGNGGSTGVLSIKSGTYPAAVELFTIADNGILSSSIANYHTLVSADGDVPNYKFLQEYFLYNDGRNKFTNAHPGTPGVLKFHDSVTNVDYLEIGNGNGASGSVMYANAEMTITSVGKGIFTSDALNTGTGGFQFKRGHQDPASAASLVTIHNNGLMTVDDPGYTALVGNDEDVVNVGYLNTVIGTGTSFVRHNPALAVDGDIISTGSGNATRIYIRLAGVNRQIWPAHYLN